MYDELRLWRGRKAKHEGIPPYLILNNRELAELAMLGFASARRRDGPASGFRSTWINSGRYKPASIVHGRAMIFVPIRVTFLPVWTRIPALASGWSLRNASRPSQSA